MKIITQLVILTLSLLLVNADDDKYCSNLIRDFRNNCTASNVTIKSCCDLKTLLGSGVYKINKGAFDKDALAYCDMVTAGGGWMVIQRNKRSSSVSFNRNWTDYEKGFGDLNTEFWYGLEELHCLTQRGQWEMRIDFQQTNNVRSYLHYNNFSIGSANEEYPLTIGGFTGVGTDRLAYHNRMKFSTQDNDNDRWGSNCAASHRGGWWFNACVHSNINQQVPYIAGYNVLSTEMKIRPKDCIIQ